MFDTKELEKSISTFPVLGNWPEDESIVEAEEVKAIAEQLIPRFHPELGNAKIAYVFKEKNGTKGDKLVLGTMKKAGRELKFFSNIDFIMTIGWEGWTELSAFQKIALVDHELCHGVHLDEKDAWSIRPHSIEEFRQIIDRYGFWKDDLKIFGEKCKEIE